MVGYDSKGVIVAICDNIVTIEVDGYPYDFPQAMIPNNAEIHDTIVITKESIGLIKNLI